MGVAVKSVITVVLLAVVALVGWWLALTFGPVLGNVLAFSVGLPVGSALYLMWTS